MDPLQTVLIIQQQIMVDQSNILVQLLRRNRRRRRRRSFWVRPWLAADRRLQFGQYDSLMAELRVEDTTTFFNYLRMPPEMFDELVNRTAHRMLKKDTNYRKALEPGLKLAITIRYLASGDNYPSLSYDFRVSRHTIANFLPHVCRAIVEEYKDEVITCPVTQDAWKNISEEFERKWNVRHAVGALDGKHVALRKPPSSGSLYHNYKGFFSIVLLALVDANYKFLWIDCGGMGHMSDAQIFNSSELKECLEDESICFPDPEPMTNDDIDMPYFILADDAFALRTYLMKPYSRRGLDEEEHIANYRISRGRRVVENAFGILANRWRALLKTFQQGPDVVRDAIEAAVCLHNIMRMRYPALQNTDMDHEDKHHDVIPGEWRQGAHMHDMTAALGTNRDTNDAKRQRDYLKLYFNSPAGSVPWQRAMINPRNT